MSTPQMPLGEVANLVMGTSPRGDTYNHEGKGLPLLNGPTEFGSFHPYSTLFTTDSKRECKPGDLIFCVRGSTTGRMNWADQTYSLGRGVCSIRGETPLDTAYIRYCLDYKLRELLNLAGGGTFPNLRAGTIASFSIPFSSSRHKIASVLSSYDDLIENNTRRIQILEEMAQRIYQEWFVNFRFPGHEKVRMVQSEIGPIPEGWEIKQVAELCELVSRGVTPKYSAGSGRYVINQKANRGSYISLAELKELDPNLRVPEPKFAHYGDLLVNSLGEGTIGRVHYFTGPHKIWAVDQHMSICRSHRFEHTAFLYMVLASEEGQEKIQSLKTGGTNMTMFNISALRQFEVVYPQESLVKSFYEIVKPLWDLRQSLARKNTNLRHTRDLLLPKLISGEVDVERLASQDSRA